MASLSLLSPQTRSAVANTLAVFLIALAMTALPRFAFAQRGPDVVIIAEEDKMIYEFRQNGELRMIRVVPNLGRPYYLVPLDPTQGSGDLQRVDALVPSWVLWEFD